MKKLIRAAVVSLSVACAAGAMALPGMAACAPRCTRCTADTSGAYRTSMSQAQRTVTAQSFKGPTVYANPTTHAISNVYDTNGNLISATLSSDGHFYIVPTNEGYLYIGTGY